MIQIIDTNGNFIDYFTKPNDKSFTMSINLKRNIIQRIICNKEILAIEYNDYDKTIVLKYNGKVLIEMQDIPALNIC